MALQSRAKTVRWTVFSESPSGCAAKAAGSELPHAPAAWENKKVLISLSNKESQKDQVLMIGKTLKDLGFTLVGTQGTADFYNANGIKCEVVNKIGGGRPDVVDMIWGLK